MPPRVVSNSAEIGKQIKERRIELGLTIEEAAKKAGVGSKTWLRYESGEAIRSDKLAKVLYVLKWKTFPPEDDDMFIDDPLKRIDSSHEAWSSYLADVYGSRTACAFAVGCELLSDCIADDLKELATLPRGAHIGQLDVSRLEYALPSQFLTRYDYEFVFSLRQSLNRLKSCARSGLKPVAHTVLEEIAIYLIELEADSFLDLFGIDSSYKDECPEGLLGEVCGDLDVCSFLYSDFVIVEPEDTYHFDNWLEPQFYLGE